MFTPDTSCHYGRLKPEEVLSNKLTPILTQSLIAVTDAKRARLDRLSQNQLLPLIDDAGPEGPQPPKDGLGRLTGAESRAVVRNRDRGPGPEPGPVADF